MKQAAKSEVMSYKTLKHDSFNQFVIAPSGAGMSFSMSEKKCGDQLFVNSDNQCVFAPSVTGMSFSMSESNAANRKWEMQCN